MLPFAAASGPVSILEIGGAVLFAVLGFFFAALLIVSIFKWIRWVFD